MLRYLEKVEMNNKIINTVQLEKEKFLIHFRQSKSWFWQEAIKRIKKPQYPSSFKNENALFIAFPKD